MNQREKHTYCIFVLILLSVISQLPQTNASETTTPSPQHPSQNQQQPPSIQSLINAADPNTTLNLPPGIYPEAILINKPLHLIGNNTTLNPTSEKNSYTIHITAENVHLSNLRITNQAAGLYTTAIKISTPQTTITNCTITDTPIGIALWASSTTITTCTFSHCQDEGIILLGTPEDPCTNNTITHCTFIENCDGIELQHASDNHITTCRFERNTHAGIDAIETDNNHNTISSCSFTDNTAFAIYLAHSTHNLITHCTFTNDILTLVHASDNILQNSHIQHINLIDNSSLILNDCTKTTTEHIHTDRSTYKIQPTNQGPQRIYDDPIHARYHQILIFLISRLKTFKTFLAELSEVRM